MGKVRFDDSFFRRVDEQLAHMPIELREKALKKAIREGAKVVGMQTRQLITKPGYPGDKDTAKYPPLSKNIKWVVRNYDEAVAGFVSSDYKVAPHFHLYDAGHRIVPGGGRVEGKHDFQRAIDETKRMQQVAMIKAMRKFRPKKVVG